MEETKLEREQKQCDGSAFGVKFCCRSEFPKGARSDFDRADCL